MKFPKGREGLGVKGKQKVDCQRLLKARKGFWRPQEVFFYFDFINLPNFARFHFSFSIGLDLFLFIVVCPK